MLEGFFSHCDWPYDVFLLGQTMKKTISFDISHHAPPFWLLCVHIFNHATFGVHLPGAIKSLTNFNFTNTHLFIWCEIYFFIVSFLTAFDLEPVINIHVVIQEPLSCRICKWRPLHHLHYVLTWQKMFIWKIPSGHVLDQILLLLKF